MTSAIFSCLLVLLYSLSIQALPGRARPWLEGSPIFAVDPPVYPSPHVQPDPRTYPAPGPRLAVDPPVYQHQGRRPGVEEAAHRPQPEQYGCSLINGCQPGDFIKKIDLKKINKSLDDLNGDSLLNHPPMCRIGLANVNDKVLNNPQFYMHKGVQDTMPAYELLVGQTILLLFEGTCPILKCYGTEGVMTYDISGTTQKVALMWLQPRTGAIPDYSSKIIEKDIPTNKDLFNEMKSAMKKADGVVSTTRDQGVWMETVMYVDQDKKSKLILRLNTTPPTPTGTA